MSNTELITIITSVVSSIFQLLIVFPVTRLLLPRGSASDFRTYEEWYAHQDDVDEVRSVKEWAAVDADRSYNFQKLQGFKKELEICRHEGNLRGLSAHLRYQAWTRNICNVLSPALYQMSCIRTKALISDYSREVRRCVSLMTTDARVKYAVMISKQEKRDLLRDMQSSLGKTTLLLQGGALVSMCHLGVIRALYNRGLLPRIITGTGTGALIAGLIGSTAPKDLRDVLNNCRIDLGAFARARASRKRSEAHSWSLPRWWRAFLRRAKRFAYSGHFFDINVLTDCARDNVGDLTFEEAREKSGLVLNITIAMPQVAGTPVLLNHITAPHVLVWSAIAASVATSKQLYAPTHLYCKDDTGQVQRYFAVDAAEAVGKRAFVHPGTALERIGELFNVSHFIVSQTRPYIIPFIKLQEWTEQWFLIGTTVKLILSELVHWLLILKWIGILPVFFQRIIIDETLPHNEHWSKVTISPQLSFRDYFAIFDLPNPKKILDFAVKGERSVWPRICELRIRCAVELDVDAATKGL